MRPITTPLELFRHLPRTNCGGCGMPSCLAFAAAVIRDEKRLDECLPLGPADRERLSAAVGRQVNLETIREEQLRELRKALAATDIVSRAPLLGAQAGPGSITIRSLGKDFEVDRSGNVRSLCHTHSWFSLPLLDYILHSAGETPTGRWVPFRELPSGGTWDRLFARRCEEPLARIADVHSELFADLADMFSGSTSAASPFGSDLSVLLHPFPKVPLLVCYWRAEEDLPSRLHLFFDGSAERNLPIASLFTLGTGLARMFEKIMHRHTAGRSELS